MILTVTDGGKIIKEYLLDSGFSTSQIRTLKKIESGITVNGEPSTVGRLLKAGDILELKTEDVCPSPIEPEDLPLDMLLYINIRRLFSDLSAALTQIRAV